MGTRLAFYTCSSLFSHLLFLWLLLSFSAGGKHEDKQELVVWLDKEFFTSYFVIREYSSYDRVSVFLQPPETHNLLLTKSSMFVYSSTITNICCSFFEDHIIVTSLAEQWTPPVQKWFGAHGFYIACGAASRINATIFLMKGVEEQKHACTFIPNTFPVCCAVRLCRVLTRHVFVLPALYLFPASSQQLLLLLHSKTQSVEMFSHRLFKTLPESLSFISYVLSLKRSLLQKNNIFIPLLVTPRQVQKQQRWVNSTMQKVPWASGKEWNWIHTELTGREVERYFAFLKLKWW